MKANFFIKSLIIIPFFLCAEVCKAQCTFNFSFVVTNSDCGNANGSITINPTGGNPPFLYSINGGIYQPFSVFNNLPPGPYEVSIRDIVGCTESLNVFVEESPVNTWTGNVDTAWENPANWSCAIVPNETSVVKINSGTVRVSSNATIYSLQLGPAVNFAINTGYTFTVLH